jgi:NDP-sugar pyrophosphorylase family protein
MSIQLIIPMAGKGARFAERGYTRIKPMLPIAAITMIEVVLQNLISPIVETVTIVTRTDIAENYDLRKLLAEKYPKVDIVTLEAMTSGPASTVMEAFKRIDPEKPVLIANSDQYIDIDFQTSLIEFLDSDLDGFIWGMEDTDPKWSYVAINDSGFVSKVKEKQVISNIATCGVYAFKSGRLFESAYSKMVECEDKTNGEFYVAPTYNYLIDSGYRIGVANLGPTSAIMHGLGTPEDYEAFLIGPMMNRFT